MHTQASECLKHAHSRLCRILHLHLEPTGPGSLPDELDVHEQTSLAENSSEEGHRSQSQLAAVFSMSVRRRCATRSMSAHGRQGAC